MATLLHELCKDAAELAATSTVEGSAMRIFLVQGSAGERATDIVGAAGLPRVNRDSHPANPYMLCKRKSAERMQGSRTLWTVSCSYDTAASGASGSGGGLIGDEGQDPFAWDADLEVGAEQQVDNVPQDADGVFVADAAGTPFAGGLQRLKALPTIRLTQYEPASVDLVEKIKTYVNTRNSDKFLKDGDQGKWLCKSITGRAVRISGSLAWQVSYEVQYDSDSHRVKFANAGPKYRSLDANFAEVLTKYQDPVYRQNDICLLTPTGFLLGDGEEPNYLYFQPYSAVAWAPVKIRRRK